VRWVNLADDELWRSIAANTDAMSELPDQRDKLNAEISRLSDPAKRPKLMKSYVAAVSKFEFEYRYPSAEHGVVCWSVTMKT
jgi:cell division protein FtsB